MGRMCCQRGRALGAASCVVRLARLQMSREETALDGGNPVGTRAEWGRRSGSARLHSPPYLDHCRLHLRAHLASCDSQSPPGVVTRPGQAAILRFTPLSGKATFQRMALLCPSCADSESSMAIYPPSITRPRSPPNMGGATASQWRIDRRCRRAHMDAGALVWRHGAIAGGGSLAVLRSLYSQSRGRGRGQGAGKKRDLLGQRRRLSGA